MLQCGGSNNHSAALLKEVFLHERRNEDHMRRLCKSPRTAPKGNRTGILPCITQHTDIASLRRSPRSRMNDSHGRQSPRTLNASLSGSGSFGGPQTFDLPNKGIGYGIPLPPESPRSDGAAAGGRTPRHGRLPPYDRKNHTSEFYDSVQANGIACLCPQATVGGK